MKCALLADIHGNRPALAAVLAAAKADHVEHLLIAGDLVGYYYEPAACLDLLAAWPMTCVRGNHEDLLDQSDADAARAAALHAKYGSGLREASRSLTTAARTALAKWPRVAALRMDGCRIVLCHGAPWATDEYVYPDARDETWTKFAVDEADLVVFGHTHHRVDRQMGATRIVNPGSVGQPRDGAAGACWATFDTVTREYRSFVVPYEREGVAAEARRRDPHLPYLAAVLCRVRPSA